MDRAGQGGEREGWAGKGKEARCGTAPHCVRVGGCPSLPPSSPPPILFVCHPSRGAKVSTLKGLALSRRAHPHRLLSPSPLRHSLSAIPTLPHSLFPTAWKWQPRHNDEVVVSNSHNIEVATSETPTHPLLPPSISLSPPLPPLLALVLPPVSVLPLPWFFLLPQSSFLSSSRVSLHSLPLSPPQLLRRPPVSRCSRGA